MGSWGTSFNMSLVRSSVTARPRAGVSTRSRRLTTIVRAEEDPYKFLGIPRNADSGTVNRIYKQKMFEAGKDEERKAQIEAAHSAIVMSSLTARLSGGASVPKEIQFADNIVIFPWRPKPSKSLQNELIANAVICGFTLLWLVALPISAFQPLTAAILGMSISNIFKQYQYFPVQQGSKDTSQGWKNIFRGFGMTIGPAAAGIFLFFSLPDLIAAALGKALPFWFYSQQALICTAAANTLMFILGSFFR